jgi:hypothetical protein
MGAAARAQYLPPPPQAPTQYCAEYYDGSSNCGIPSLQECEQTISGVGGQCNVDPGPRPQNPIQRMFRPQQTPVVPDIDPPPPPPDE